MYQTCRHIPSFLSQSMQLITKYVPEKFIDMWESESIEDCFAGFTVTGKYIIDCLTRNEELKPDIVYQIDEIKAMLY